MGSPCWEWLHCLPVTESDAGAVLSPSFFYLLHSLSVPGSAFLLCPLLPFSSFHPCTQTKSGLMLSHLDHSPSFLLTSCLQPHSIIHPLYRFRRSLSHPEVILPLPCSQSFPKHLAVEFKLVFKTLNGLLPTPLSYFSRLQSLKSFPGFIFFKIPATWCSCSPWLSTCRGSFP